jgi:hypothetical protein
MDHSTRILFTVAIPILLAVVISGGIAYAVITNDKFFDVETGTPIQTNNGRFGPDMSPELRNQVTRSLASSELRTYAELNTFILRVRNSSRTDIPRARAFEAQWGALVASSYVELQALQQLPIDTLTSKELQDVLSKIQRNNETKQRILSFYHTIPATELQHLIDQPVAKPSTTAVPDTSQKLTVIDIAFPYITVTAQDMQPNTVFLILKQGTEDQYQLLPPQTFVYGGTATVSIPMRKDAVSGTYIVRAANNAWHVDSAPFKVLH